MSIAKKFQWSIFTALVLLMVGLSGLTAPPALGSSPPQVRVLIAFAHPPGYSERTLVRRAGGTVRHSYHLVDAIAATVPERAVDGLRANPNVLRVEPDLRGRAVDTELVNAWGVTRIGAGTVHSADNTGAGVKVAVVDSGVNYNHPELDGVYVGGYDYIEMDDDPMDVYGHGTHVAGTACAENNDNGVADPKLGVVGAAPSCALYALRVLDDDGWGYASETIAAMEWAVENDIDVANLSLGWDRDPGVTLQQAFDNAWNAGMVVVAAAGNSGNPAGKGNSVIYPAKYESVIAVAATDDKDKRASFSSTGAEVELAAPGVSVYSTWNDETGYYDPQPVCGTDANGESGCYKYGSGTSMASPHVAGAAALVMIANPGWSNAQVRAHLQATADDLGDAGRDPQFGYGLVDAAEAAAPTAPLTDLGIAAVDAPNSVLLGDPAAVAVTVANAGSEDVATTIAVILTDETDGVAIGTQTIEGGLAAGDSALLTFSWDTTGASTGEHVLSAAHDFTDGNTTNDRASTTVMVREETAGVAVTGITPDRIAAGTTVDVTVTGSGFASGASLIFEGGTGPAPEASGITVVDDSTIAASVYVKSGPPKSRMWDVRVTNPDGSTAALVDGLTVDP